MTINDDLAAALTEAFECPKMLRETLCVAQSAIIQSIQDEDRRKHHIERLNQLIAVCDEMRPVGPDGKHNDRHTEFCGCDDK